MHVQSLKGIKNGQELLVVIYNLSGLQTYTLIDECIAPKHEPLVLQLNGSVH